jgi:putative oxidoreductase
VFSQKRRHDWLMKNKLPCIVRTLLGLIFLIFGLNGFFHFLPMPPMKDAVGALMGAYAQTGYMFPFIFVTQTLVGIMLLTNSWAPLALVILAPVVVHIILFHIFLDPSGLPMPIVVLVAGIYLAYSWRGAYAPLLKRKN